MDEKKVLVVEDNLVNQMVIKGMLGKIGVPFDLANNGQEALEKVGAHAYDLILMDCQMPVLDGYSATEKIRQLESDAAKIPIVALTAHALAEEAQRCSAVGMNDFLSKPLTMDVLRNMLEKWLK